MVSIVLPVYNGERYIKNAIEIVLSQTYCDWELIIINDGSTDNTQSICEEMQAIDARIKVYRQENNGVSSARNLALSIAIGEYITFIDCDDSYTNTRLEKMVGLIQADEECDIVYSDYHVIMNSEIVNFEVTDTDTCFFEKIDFLNRVFLVEKMNAVWRCLLKTEIAKKIDFKGLYFAEDYFYILDYVAKIRKGVFTSDKLYFYNKDNIESMTNNSRNRKYLKNYQTIPILVYNYMCENSLFDEKYKKKLMREYAFAGIRLKRITTYKEFVSIVSEPDFRNGLNSISYDKTDMIKTILAFLIKKGIYFPFTLLKNQAN